MTDNKPTRERLNLRLPPDLKDELQTFADTMGITLNGAAILALRNYLPFARSRLQPPAPKPPTARKPRVSEWDAPVVTKVVRPQAKVGRNDPCPCGSGKKAKHCHTEYT